MEIEKFNEMMLTAAVHSETTLTKNKEEKNGR